MGGVLIAAPMGFYVQYFQMRAGASEASFSFAAATQAFTWMVTTLIALAFILQGKVEPHRRWMTRSFSVALVFLEVRVLLGVTGWEVSGLMSWRLRCGRAMCLRCSRRIWFCSGRSC